MAVYIRTKRVTDPLDERVLARLRGAMTGYASSGSEHDGAVGEEDQSCFSNLINEFLEHANADEELDKPGSGEDADSVDDAAMDRAAEQANRLRELLESSSPLSHSFRLQLKSELQVVIGLTGSECRRTVMAHLRKRGYNAGICKARWENAGKLTAGSYEYIDVVDESAAGEADRRYIVDLRFAAEFKVARGTEEYERVLEGVPKIAVALPEEVRAAVKIVAEAARRSLKSKGLCVPPWRKRKYMMAKWLGPYRRTVNLIPAVTAVEGCGEIKCREVGFGAPTVVGVKMPVVAVEKLGKLFW